MSSRLSTNSSIYRYSRDFVRKKLREFAERLCVELAPEAVEIEVHSPLDKVSVFVKCR